MLGYSSLAIGFLITRRRLAASSSRGVIISRSMSTSTPEQQESLIRSYLEMYDGTKKSIEDVRPILNSVFSPDAVVVTPSGELDIDKIFPTIAKFVEGGAKNTVHALKQISENDWEYQVEVNPGGDADPMMVRAHATFNSDGKVARVEPLNSETKEIYKKALPDAYGWQDTNGLLTTSLVDLPSSRVKILKSKYCKNDDSDDE